MFHKACELGGGEKEGLVRKREQNMENGARVEALLDEPRSLMSAGGNFIVIL